jgi:hypothetical protein
MLVFGTGLTITAMLTAPKLAGPALLATGGDRMCVG